MFACLPSQCQGTKAFSVHFASAPKLIDQKRSRVRFTFTKADDRYLVYLDYFVSYELPRFGPPIRWLNNEYLCHAEFVRPW